MAIVTTLYYIKILCAFELRRCLYLRLSSRTVINNNNSIKILKNISHGCNIRVNKIYLLNLSVCLL